MRIAVYPLARFDPIMFGHMDVIRRATEVFDRVVVAVLINTRKVPTATGEDRVRVIRESVREAGLDEQDRVHVMTFEGLTVELADAVGRATSCVACAPPVTSSRIFQMAHMTHCMAPDVDTVFFMTGIDHAYLSSSPRARDRGPRLRVGHGAGARGTHAAAPAGRGLTPPVLIGGPVGYNAVLSPEQRFPAIDIIFLIERLEARPHRLLHAHDQLGGRGPGGRARSDRPAARRRAGGDPPGEAHQRGDQSPRGACPGIGRAHPRACPGAGRLPHRGQVGATRAAELRSRQIIDDGEAEAEDIRQGADAYAASVLVSLRANA